MPDLDILNLKVVQFSQVEPDPCISYQFDGLSPSFPIPDQVTKLLGLGLKEKEQGKRKQTLVDC